MWPIAHVKMVATSPFSLLHSHAAVAPRIIQASREVTAIVKRREWWFLEYLVTVGIASLMGSGHPEVVGPDVLPDSMVSATRAR